MHDGIDISAPAGSAVLAADDGKVTYSGNTIRGYGNMIVLKHAGNLATVYAHNRKNLVHEGEMVRRGQKIAEVGETGRATGSHCHFEVRLGKQAVNPLFYLKEAK
jgi:murein DD-endopeptidase MepM/ murein hydrolase activator NlpD